MPVFQGGETVGLVGALVLLVAHADEGRFKQGDEQREHLVARCRGAGEVAANFLPETGQGAKKGRQPAVLLVISLGDPGGVIAILLSMPRITSGSLNASVGIG